MNAFDSVYKMTFASADPLAAREFAVNYLGAQYELGANSSGCSHIEWVNFSHTKGSRLPFEFHFVKDWKYPHGGMTIDQFEDKMAKLHGGFSSFDSFMDYHITLATDDLDPVASKLLAAGRPLLVRHFRGSFSMFVEVPHGIVLEIVSSKLTVMKPQVWNRCGIPQRPAMINRISTANSGLVTTAPIPPMRPIRAVYASTAPVEDADFFVTYFGAEKVAEQHRAETALGAGNGTCYNVQAVRFHSNSSTPVTGITEFEVWWIDSPGLRHGNYTVAQHENFLKVVHGNFTQTYDRYMDNHLGLFYGQSDEFIEHLQHKRVPFFSSGTFGAGAYVHVPYTGLFLQGPTGQVYERLALNQTVLPSEPTWPTILCNGTVGPRPLQILV